MVFCSHLPIRGHWYVRVCDTTAFGVSIFFCLSAYLIVTLLLMERDDTGNVRLGAFALRRILRIWPPYFAVLFIGFFIGLVRPGAHMTGRALLAMSILLGNYFVINHGWQAIAAITPLWSISIEEQFYIAVPFLTRLGGRRAIIAVCSATLFVAYSILIWLGSRGLIPIWQIWANSFVEFQFFALGGLLAALLYRRRLEVPVYARILLASGGLSCFYAAAVCGIHGWVAISNRHLVVGYLLALLGTGAVFVSILDVRVTVPRPLIYLGKISYGLYLIHLPIIWLLFHDTRDWSHTWLFHSESVRLLVTVILTFVLAALSYRYFERPILRLKSRFETVKTRPA